MNMSSVGEHKDPAAFDIDAREAEIIGQYYATALQQNSLRVRLADDNGGLRHR